MRIELTYNAALYRQLSAINWKITYARSIKYSRVIVAVSLVMLCIGIYTIADAEGQTPLASLIVTGLGLLLFGMARMFQGIQAKMKKDYDRDVAALALAAEQNPVRIIEANSTRFYYKGHDMELTTDWTYFKAFREVQDILFIYGMAGHNFMVAKSQVPEADYNELKRLLSVNMRFLRK